MTKIIAARLGFWVRRTGYKIYMASQALSVRLIDFAAQGEVINEDKP